MRGGAGLVFGALSLAVLDGIVSRQSAASNVGGFLANTGKAVDWFLSPQIPAFKVTAPSSNVPMPAATGPVTVTPPGKTNDSGVSPSANVSSSVPALSPGGNQTLA